MGPMGVEIITTVLGSLDRCSIRALFLLRQGGEVPSSRSTPSAGPVVESHHDPGTLHLVARRA